MKNIHLIPTDKPSRLWVNNLRRRLELDEFPSQHPSNIAKHIYITNDEEIKDRNCWVTNGVEIFKPSDLPEYSLEYANRYWKKIILTTDPDLIQDGVQAIDDEFLKWFIQNPSCESVEVEKGFADGSAYGYDFLSYKIIIPQKEPKQKTIEEAADLWSIEPNNVHPTDSYIAKKGFLEGAKSDAARDYWFSEFKKK
jgi:hypothetical protein